MPRQPINWDALTEVPTVSSPLLDSGYITRVFLPPIEGEIRKVQAKYTLYSKLFAPVAAHNHNKTSNWLNHVRDKHPQEAQTLRDDAQTQASNPSVSATDNLIRPFLLDSRIRLTNQKLRQDVLNFIVECNVPIRAVDSTAFQQLLTDLRAPGTIHYINKQWQ
jgi:hypothetical protein